MNSPRDFGRPPQIVGIDRRDELALRHGNAVIARGSHAAIWLLQQFDAGIVSRMKRDEGRGFIGRAIIDNDDLQIAMGLRSNAAQRGIDRIRRVERGDDHTDKMTRRHRSTSSTSAYGCPPFGSARYFCEDDIKVNALACNGTRSRPQLGHIASQNCQFLNAFTAQARAVIVIEPSLCRGKS